MRILAGLIGTVIVWIVIVAAIGAGGNESPGMVVGGLAIGGVLLLAAMPKPVRRLALGLGALVVAGVLVYAWSMA